MNFITTKSPVDFNMYLIQFSKKSKSGMMTKKSIEKGVRKYGTNWMKSLSPRLNKSLLS